MLLEHCIRRAASRPAWTAGSNNAAKIPVQTHIMGIAAKQMISHNGKLLRCRIPGGGPGCPGIPALGMEAGGFSEYGLSLDMAGTR